MSGSPILAKKGVWWNGIKRKSNEFYKKKKVNRPPSSLWGEV